MHKKEILHVRWGWWESKENPIWPRFLNETPKSVFLSSGRLLRVKFPNEKAVKERRCMYKGHTLGELSLPLFPAPVV